MESESISFVCQVGECESCSGWIAVNSSGDEEPCICTCHDLNDDDDFNIEVEEDTYD